jgi:hypothetical protein
MRWLGWLFAEYQTGGFTQLSPVSVNKDMFPHFSGIKEITTAQKAVNLPVPVVQCESKVVSQGINRD